MKPLHVLVPVVCLVLGAPVPASARQGSEATPQARFHFGPLSLTPKLAIQNLGVDTNVFNSPETPVRDTTATMTPGLDAWLRVGRVLFSSKTATDVIYYQKAASQRTFNLVQDGRMDVDLLFARPRVVGVYLRTRQRPNDEIDERVQQKHVSGGAGVTVPIGARLRIDADARRTRYDFSQGAYGDATIAQALNRDSDEIGMTGRMELSSLTSVAVKTEFIRDRFVFTPDRDSDSLRVMPGVVFQPSAFVSGSAFVGFRQLTTLNPAIPDFSGVVAAVELKYVALDMFRVIAQVKRDVDYSLDLGEPFFISTSAGAEVLQAIGLSWDIVARVRVGRLEYQATQPGIAGRTDRLRIAGVGIGRRIGDDLRIGVDLDHVSRSSAVVSRAFDGLRFGGSLTYGY